VLAAVEQKAQGQEITVMPAAPQAEIIDLFEALKRSLKSAAPAANEGKSEPPAAAEPAAEAAASGDGEEVKPVKKTAPPRKAAGREKKAAG
jgi:DNA end-binding protein Ku